MSYKLNGINYTEMLLTDEELAVVKAMRDGADLDIKFWGIKNMEEAIEKANMFGNVKRIYDLETAVSFGSGTLISKINCSAYINKKD